MNKRYEKYKPIYKEFIPFYPLTLEDLPNEIWKVIPNYEDYHCSNFGRIKSFKWDEPKILKPSFSEGYLVVSLSKSNHVKVFRLNRLVGLLFIPNPENKPEVNHLHGRFNNYFECLEWATSSENEQHAYATGLAPSKLSAAQILEIRENPQGLTIVQLAEKFGVTDTAISKIQLGKTYKKVGGSLREKIETRIPENIREEIRVRRAAGERVVDLATEYGVHRTTISNIIRGK